jgi:putative zinc finger/helix-turn-helix YgiT family protein
MKSPYTEEEMILIKDKRILAFRKEQFEIIYHSYLCEKSKESFTTTELDEINIFQLYNLYREKHNIPFPDEIRAIRKKYGLSASKMSQILGFGINVYRNYENGEVPSSSNARLLHLAKRPKEFLTIVKICNDLNVKERDPLIDKVNGLIDLEKNNYFESELEAMYLGGFIPNRLTGFVKPNFSKFTEMVKYFTIHCTPWKTKLNKLMFYADFNHFKHHCYSISGANYRAINMGPVVNNYNSSYEYIAESDSVDIHVTLFDSGYVGEQFMPNSNTVFNDELFNDAELKSLERVCEVFKDTTTKEIINISHKEDAWIQNFENGRKMISYIDAFSLSQI